jgi:hypothetical protein
MAKARKKRERDQRDDLLDTIDFKGLTQEEALGQKGLIKQLTGRALQKALEAELTEHLGYEKHDSAGDNSGDSRNVRRIFFAPPLSSQTPSVAPEIWCKL